MLETALAKLLTLKAGATVLAVTATGGVAVAAANGALPHPLTEAGAKPSAHATGAPADKGTTTGSTGAKGTPSPSLVGLCRAYVAKAADNPGKALENPAFTVLVTTAGDREKVAAYCDSLLAAEKGKPSGRPSTRSSVTPSRPAGKPDVRPGAPESPRTEHPGGGHRPSTPPTT
ncbi:hypothetical protein GA0070614_2025 [Micromonospora coxensis]|uniref:Uncharacterized protein n=2 Tax=Micromonospora coxensis TaxID=356852 RepID=A0A1C5I044_9ACTN|nr:hypothetical protein GA0070614_2025 [Micromonospora coxensis]